MNIIKNLVKSIILAFCIMLTIICVIDTIINHTDVEVTIICLSVLCGVMVFPRFDLSLYFALKALTTRIRTNGFLLNFCYGLFFVAEIGFIYLFYTCIRDNNMTHSIMAGTGIIIHITIFIFNERKFKRNK